MNNEGNFFKKQFNHHCNMLGDRAFLFSNEFLITFAEAEKYFENLRVGKKNQSKETVVIYAKHSVKLALLLSFYITEDIPYLLIPPEIRNSEFLEIIDKYNFGKIVLDKKFLTKFDFDFIDYNEDFLYVDLKKINKNQDDFALLLLTSGTTAASKLVKIDYENLVSRAKGEIKLFEIDASSHILNVLNFSHDLGLNQLLTALGTGATLEIFNNIFPKSFHDRVLKGGFTHLTCMPTVWIYFLKIVDLSLVIELSALLTVSGGSLEAGELIKLRALFPKARWIKTYGQTETFRSLGQSNQSKFTSAELSSMIDGVKVFLLDDKLKKIEVGEIGRLYHFGQGRMSGYLDGVNDSLVIIQDDGNEYECIDTGDYFKRLSENTFEYTGRKDDMIKYSGRRFYANEIEKIVNNSLGVINSFAFCIMNNDHALKHEKLVVAIESSNKSVDELRSLCIKKLDHYKVPDEFIFFESFPISISGKIDKRKIKELVTKMSEAKNVIA